MSHYYPETTGAVPKDTTAEPGGGSAEESRSHTTLELSSNICVFYMNASVLDALWWEAIESSGSKALLQSAIDIFRTQLRYYRGSFVY